MFFKNRKHDEPLAHHEYGLKSAYGRGITSIKSAHDELYLKLIDFNPMNHLRKGEYFLGVDHIIKDPLYLRDPIHTQIVAPTRSGKGVYIGIKVVEALRENKGLVIVDPKEDDFLPQVLLEELDRQDRIEDLQIISWPNDFGYTVFSPDDLVEEATKKMTIMLNLIEDDAELGASFYRKSERIILSIVMRIFFQSKELLELEIDRTLAGLSQFLKYIISDLNANYEFVKEQERSKPNFDKLEKLSKRYFNPELFAKLNLKYSQVATLESLQFSISEFENVAIHNKYELADALTKGKVLYIKSDMLDETALKFLKLVIADIIQQSKKLKKDTNCLVILDELSFYPTQILSAGLATVAGFGVKFILAYQSEAQMRDESLRVAIKDNCQTKIYYKSSDDTTLKYIELLSGLELVSQVSKKGNETTVRQMQEPHMNITRLRALPRSRVAILIEENSNQVHIFQTAPVPVRNPFDWNEINIKEIDVNHFSLSKKFAVSLHDKQIDSTQSSESQQPKELVL
jgi:type IV secretory pathway TraG/TraD family ATPase VirD4